MQVNIPPAASNDEQSWRITGQLKLFPRDFVVTECPRVNVKFLKEEKATKGTTQATIPREPLLSSAEWTALDALNKQVATVFDAIRHDPLTAEVCCAVLTAQKVLIPCPEDASKSERGAIHSLIKHSFSFLTTSIDGTSNSGNGVCYFICASPDMTFLKLVTHTRLSLLDVEALYAFKNKGARHDEAEVGITMGVGLEREQRTLVYQILQSSQTSLDSKTMQPGGQQQRHQQQSNKKRKQDTSSSSSSSSLTTSTAISTAYMHVFWKNKARRPKHGGDGDSTVPDGPVVYLQCTLMKHNSEHCATVKQLATVLKVDASSDLSFAGTKDKRAITYQQCVVAVRAGGMTSESLPEKVARVIATLRSLTPPVGWDNDRNSNSSEDHDPSSSSSSLPPTTTASTLRQERPDQSHDDTRSFFAITEVVENPVSEPLSLGQLWGNHFRITLRNLSITPTCDFLTSHPSSSSSSCSSSSPPVPLKAAKGLTMTTPGAYLQAALTRVQQDGFPNYFGSQRMGKAGSDADEAGLNTAVSSAVPSGVIIGKLMLLGQYREAVDVILLDDYCDQDVHHVDDDNGKDADDDGDVSTPLLRARRLYRQGASIATVLQALPRASPSAMSKEGIVLRAMQRLGITNPHTSTGIRTTDTVADASGSAGIDAGGVDTNVADTSVAPVVSADQWATVLRQIPYSLRSMWVTSYQSWLWNRMAAERLSYREGGDDHPMVMAGDLVMDTTDGQGPGLGLGLGVDQVPREGGNGPGDDSGVAVTDDTMVIIGGDDGGIEDGLHDCIPSSSSSSSSFAPSVHMLTVQEVSSLTIEQRRTLFRDAAVLPLFGRKVLFPLRRLSTGENKESVTLSTSSSSYVCKYSCGYVELLRREGLLTPGLGLEHLDTDTADAIATFSSSMSANASCKAVSSSSALLPIASFVGSTDTYTVKRTNPPLPPSSTSTSMLLPSSTQTTANANSTLNVVSVPKGAYRKIIQKVVNPSLIMCQRGDKDMDTNNRDHGTMGEMVEEYQLKRIDVMNSHGESVSDNACTVVLSFSLPAGSFATALLRELTQNDDFI